MPDRVRVRFAPSPTGPPHLGSLRTALFNWLLAASTGGTFGLRIDDTDRERYDPLAEAQMLSALHWFGLEWEGDAPFYRQSQRLALYQAAAQRLIDEGAAYRPSDAPEIVRLRIPEAGGISVQDVLRGPIYFAWAEVPEDPVLLKSDGYPTYHLANALDDAEWGTTHILRGEEWIPSTPVHVLLFQALGASVPQFVHLPLVTDTEGRKFSKRSADAQVQLWIDAGCLPEALMNHLALLGWHPDTQQEIFSGEELVAAFTLERLSKSPAAFDPERLHWFNRQHVTRLGTAKISERIWPLLAAAYPQAAAWDETRRLPLTEAIFDEITLLGDAVPAARFAFVYDLNAEARQELDAPQAAEIIAALRAKLQSGGDNPAADMLADLRAQFKASHKLGGRAVMMPLRAALTGTTAGPHLDQVIGLLGVEECLRRLDQAIIAAQPG